LFELKIFIKNKVTTSEEIIKIDVVVLSSSNDEHDVSDAISRYKSSLYDSCFVFAIR